MARKLDLDLPLPPKCKQYKKNKFKIRISSISIIIKIVEMNNINKLPVQKKKTTVITVTNYRWWLADEMRRIIKQQPTRAIRRSVQWWCNYSRISGGPTALRLVPSNPLLLLANQSAKPPLTCLIKHQRHLVITVDVCRERQKAQHPWHLPRKEEEEAPISSSSTSSSTRQGKPRKSPSEPANWTRFRASRTIKQTIVKWL